MDEAYITNFLTNAVIEENPSNIDLAKLIEGKEAIVGNPDEGPKYIAYQ